MQGLVGLPAIDVPFTSFDYNAVIQYGTAQTQPPGAAQNAATELVAQLDALHQAQLAHEEQELWASLEEIGEPQEVSQGN